MTNQEMLAVLKGTTEQKKILFDELLEKASSELGLEDGEKVILEALKKDLLKPKSVVVQMNANVVGMSGVKF